MFSDDKWKLEAVVLKWLSPCEVGICRCWQLRHSGDGKGRGITFQVALPRHVVFSVWKGKAFSQNVVPVVLPKCG